MTNGDGSKNWIQESFSGVNIVGLLSVFAAVVWVVAGNYFGPDKRLTVIEQQLASMNARFVDTIKSLDDFDTQIDALRSNNTEIAIMKLTGENTAAIVNRLETVLDAVKEGQRDLQSKMRDLERRLGNE